LIAAAEAEEAAFRQLRDRWQPNSPSLFETVEQQRSKAARAQKEVEDLAMALQEKLEKASDPEELLAMEEFDAAFDLVRNDWDKFHDDYAGLSQEAGSMDNAEVLLRLEQLMRQLGAVLEAVDRLPAAPAAEDSIEMLQDAAEAELRALANVYETLDLVVMEDAAEKPDAPGEDESGQPVGPLLETMNPTIEDVEATLREVRRTTREFLDGHALADLEEVQEFVGEYERLLADWDAFHQRYNDWRRTEGGCDRTEVLQALGQFSIRIDELGRQVRDLPESGYLLPMYTLLVEAVEREEGAVRALRNSWQPFTVDAFIAVDQERDNANRLRRQANIGLQELRDRP
jgi:chemotaxis protein histidine kinase CheA